MILFLVIILWDEVKCLNFIMKGKFEEVMVNVKEMENRKGRLTKILIS